MIGLKLRISPMLESNGNVTLFCYFTKPGFKNQLHTPELCLNFCGTKNFECAIEEAMRHAHFFGLPRKDVAAEIMALHEVEYVDSEKLSKAIASWEDMFGWKYEDWK